MEAAKRGDVWGVVHLGQNFTDEIMVRQADGSASSNETIIGSQIGVSMDYSSKWRNSTFYKAELSILSFLFLDQQISLIIRRRLTDAFEDFTNDILKACDYEPDAGNIPVTVRLLDHTII